MKRLLEMAKATARLVSTISMVAGLCLLPLLFAAALVPVIGRNVNAPWMSKAGYLQPVQAPLFFALVMLSLGVILLRDRHVRIDLLRRHQTPAMRAWVDLVGTLLVLLPFTVALIWYGTRFTLEAYWIGERSDVVLDFPVLWLVKAAIPLGGLLLLLAGVAGMLRNLATVLNLSWPYLDEDPVE